MSMIAVFLSLSAFMAASEVPGPNLVPDLTEVPERNAVDSCVCPASIEQAEVSFSGYVIDAEVILGSDRRSVEDHMATIFDVKWSSNGDIKGRTRLWHTTSPASCGVSFDYGKKYSVAARWSEEGDLETDACLMRTAE